MPRFGKMKAAMFMALLCAINCIAASQELDQYSMKTAHGYVVVWNHPNNYFTLEIVGNDVKAMNSECFDVDGKLLQVHPLKINQFIGDAKVDRQDITALLVAHRDWETEYLGKTLGKTLKVESTEVKLKNGMAALLWSYDMPDGLNDEVKKQIYLSVLNGDGLILLNSAVIRTNTADTVTKFLIDTMLTLKPSAKPIDMLELRQKVMSEK